MVNDFEKVQVITDSTADIPDELLKDLDIKIVPIYLRFGLKTYRDGIDMTRSGFYDMLSSSPLHPSTSQPTPDDFISVYKECCDSKGGIVSIHVSSKISGTLNVANIARKAVNSPCPIEIIDSKFNSSGLGMVVIAAARAAKNGASFDEVVKEANLAISEVKMFGFFSTMKYLARSGRVSKTIAAASQFLNVMPLLTFHDGEVVRAGLIRSVSKGMEKIQEFVENSGQISEIIISHSRVAENALILKKKLSAFLAEEKIKIAELGAGLGVHGGPGVLLAAVRQVLSKT
jgi:DegV family protein with EDD domain